MSDPKVSFIQGLYYRPPQCSDVFVTTDVARIVFDKLCGCEAIQEDYFYRKMTYDYELLEDYQDLYNGSQRPSPQQQQQQQQGSHDKHSQQQPGQDNNWGPKHYQYHTHPLHLMVASYQVTAEVPV